MTVRDYLVALSLFINYYIWPTGVSIVQLLCKIAVWKLLQITKYLAPGELVLRFKLIEQPKPTAPWSFS